MKNLHRILGICLLATTIHTSYGCELSPKNTKNKAIIAEAIIGDENVKSDNNTVKIALLLDTSNSMDGLINQAKSQLWDIINEFTHAKCGNDTRPKLEIALYQYGNDNLSSQEGYIQQVLDFSSDLDEISEKLFSLTTNGGEEFCGQVIQTSLKQLDWGKNPDHLKMIFIAGNEPFTQGKLNYKDAVANAVEKHVVVNTIFCGNYEQGINTAWKKGATMTGGEYLAIDHNKRVVHIDTPYDDVIIKLNGKLNKTYISYGSLGASKMAMQAEQDANAEALEEVVIVKRAVSKSSRMYNNASWDLVDAMEDEDFNVAEIENEQLPQELQGKSKAAIEKYIETKKNERADIQREIQELNAKREAYIAENQKENASGELENAMLEAIKKQAEKKNYRWD
ncbi:VWA domain-containing protein [Maribacter polysiphoniae]|nr:VWA domain-containing protein [Maribacter polysiphoniae]MBD1259567.1 VWA domain-containing protein [Maribacter polysiphoniae]